MWRRWLLLGLLACTPASSSESLWPDVEAPLNTRQEGKKDAALIVGIGDYDQLPDVPGASDNARSWYRYLTQVRGVPVGNVKLLEDSLATKEEVLAAAQAVAEKTEPGGTLWFVYIGHGAPSQDQKDGVLVGADARQTANSLYSRSLSRSEVLSVLEAGDQARTVAVLDACFSGQSGAGALVPGLQPVMLSSLPAGRTTVLSAGKSNEFAGPLPGLGRPAFSYLVLGALRGWGDADGNGEVSAREAVEYAGGAMFAVVKGRTQTPELSGPGEADRLARGKERGPDITEIALALGEVDEPERPVVPVTSGTVVSSGDFVADLDVSAALAAKACDDAAERGASAQRSARMESEARTLAEKARVAWSSLGPQAEACLALDESGRSPCIAKVEEYIRWAGGLEVVLTEGFEAVQTDCGQRSVPMTAQRKSVAVRELEAAEAALAKLEGKGAGSAGKYGYEMVKLSPGSFTMGSNDGGSDEKPPHQVRISRGFSMGKTEVTQGLYKQVMGENPSYFSSCGDNCPVEKVSWFDAVTFANKLSELEGLEACYSISGSSVSWPRGLSCTGYRLPTEAEWEYAARAGQNTTYSGSNELGDVGWYDENSGSKTHPVAQKRANAWGLYDMTGNVWEWTWDRYDSSYYQSSSNVDPVGPNGGSSRVNRGGSWYSVASSARVAARNDLDPSLRSSYLGFRLSRSNP